MKRSFWTRRVAPAAAAIVATPLAFVAGMSLVPDSHAPRKAAAASPEAAPAPEPASVARIDGGNGQARDVTERDLRLTSYDARTGKARLTVGKKNTPARSVKVGDVIAGGRTPQLPYGALVKVTRVPDSSGTAQVTPATLTDLLGDKKVNQTTPVKPSDLTVKPLLKGVVASVGSAASAPATKSPPAPLPGKPLPGKPLPGKPLPGKPTSPGDVTALVGPAVDRIAPAALSAGAAGRHNVGGQLKLDLNIPLAEHGFRPTGKGGPTLSGWVHFQPQVIFAYKREHALSLAPSEAAIGIGGAYDYGWKVHAALAGKLDTGRKPLRLPFAEVHVHTTIWVGAFPIVVDAELTYFYQITASGQISIDAEQKTAGNVSLGAQYTKAAGWSRLPLTSSTITPVKQLSVTGRATATATIGAQLQVALYGMVGAALEWAPFVRADVDGRIPAPQLNWALHAGFDLRGALFAQLKIFGITLFDKTFYLPPLHAEWKLAGGLVTPPKRASTG